MACYPATQSPLTNPDRRLSLEDVDRRVHLCSVCSSRVLREKLKGSRSKSRKVYSQKKGGDDEGISKANREERHTGHARDERRNYSAPPAVLHLIKSLLFL